MDTGGNGINLMVPVSLFVNRVVGGTAPAGGSTSAHIGCVCVVECAWA